MQNILSGFRKVGIVPYDPKVITDDKYDPAALERWKLHLHRENEGQLPERDDNVTGIANEEVGNAVEKLTSFEDILLRTVQQYSTTVKEKKKRVCLGAEVITQAEVLQRIQKAVESKRTSAPGSFKRQSSKLKTLKFDDSSSDESLEEPMYTEDKDDMDPEDFGNDEDVCDTEIEIGCWVLVKYPTKKAVKHFVAQVLGKEEEGWNLKFTEYKQEKFKWPIEMDTDVMNDQDIIRVLPDPILGRRGNFIFNVDFSGFNL